MFRRYIFHTSNAGCMTTMETDVVVIGTGIAGLYTALKISEYARVLLLSKRTLTESNTNRAQGGIAAAIAEGDSPELHRDDTLAAGAGLNRPEAVDILVHESPECIRDLIRMGAEFDREDNRIALTQEAAHSTRRILHAQGDATGAEIIRTLSQNVMDSPSITVMTDTFAVDLVTEGNVCRGVIVQLPDRSFQCILAKATVLATGGTGNLYRYTTNPDMATGDGLAMAYRAGAELEDLEFVQFHPTALCYPGAPRFLLSEALRGEGAVLRNIRGERFMPDYHEAAELAPRDVVARAIVTEMERTHSTFVYLDITHKPPEKIRARFPTIYAFCLSYGLDLTTDWIPVAPAAHYMMGGVKTDLNGATCIDRLYACGEVSCTGLHGANRLASNSLSEGLVFGRRIAADIRRWMESPAPKAFRLPSVESRREIQTLHETIAAKKLHLQKVMVRYAGVKRSQESLTRALAELGRLTPVLLQGHDRPEEFEFVNLLTCAILVVQAALHRRESRGGHYRTDYPHRDDERFAKHIIFQKDAGMLEEVLE
jgi:L-aspartate oxidase